MAPLQNQATLPHALKTPAITKLSNNKRLILASASPRRKEILNTFGLNPEIVPSTFSETLPHSEFPNVYEYPVSTASEKAVEVYERLVLQNPDNPPDLVVGADTIVLTRVTPATSGLHPSLEPEVPPEILEKPGSKADNLRMLLELNGHTCEVVTGITVDNGEGVDRAGGFAAQGLGGMLIRKIDGDWFNVVGFPAAAFFKFMDILVEEEEDFLSID
ncbi:hypothetical protein FRB96_003376 [Tulasnella sp. 330]|nr:hypothetical protein FRB96_003376 [Tulasnella sp. 330]KAG8887453.1 hypothetical protein FRB98_009597 [Tulasnella sp. 332]